MVKIASRVSCLFVPTDNLSEILGYLAEVVMNVYIPTWIAIKIKLKAKEAAVIYYQMIRRVRDLKNQRDQEISSRPVQRNSYSCHQKILSLQWSATKIQFKNNLAEKKNQKTRQKAPTSNRTKSLRVLKIPEMNFEAHAYYEIIYWPSSNAGVCQNIDYADP